MREIKFRAWDEKLKCMHATDSVSLCIDGEICYLDTDGEWVADMANRITLMQYTGLKDKNGTEIYEGDVMVCRQYIGGNFIDYCIERGFVEMLHGAFGLHRKQGYYRPFKDWLEAYEYEIIGNIYENPELLK